MASKSRYYAEDIALVMELRTGGASWQLLEYVFGRGIRYAVRYAKEYGSAPYEGSVFNAPQHLVIDQEQRGEV